MWGPHPQGVEMAILQQGKVAFNVNPPAPAPGQRQTISLRRAYNDPQI